MHLVPHLPTPKLQSLLPIDGSVEGPAANDSGIAHNRHATRQINTLVASVVGQVAARVQPKNVNIQLRLAAGEPTVSTDPAELAFVVAAVLGAAVRVVDEENGEFVGVDVSAARRSIRILITSDEVPPIRFVRALDPNGCSEDVDPTLAHCRRIIEARGGSLVLTEQGGRLGFAIDLPRVYLSPRVHLLTSVSRSVPEFGKLDAA